MVSTPMGLGQELDALIDHPLVVDGVRRIPRHVDDLHLRADGREPADQFRPA
jgi:hypothetical protein